MSTFAEALTEFYGGEIVGEVVYSGLLETAKSDDQRLKLATLLQLETETKAWLRPHMIARGVSVEEKESDRGTGAAYIAQFKPLTWAQLMQGLHDAIATHYVPRYQSFADDAKRRDRPDEETVCRYMVEHEKAQLEFAKLELSGASTETSLAPINRQLKFKLTD